MNAKKIYTRPTLPVSSLPLDPEDHRQGETQALVGDHAAAAAAPGRRAFTIASAASSNAASPDPLTMLAESTRPIRSSAKADQDLGALLRALRRIALVLVEMRDQLLLPGRARPPQVSPLPLRGRDTERGPSGIASELGVAVASAATDSVGSLESAPPRSSVSSSLGFFDSFGVTTRSGPRRARSASSFGSSVSLTSACCSASAGDATDASVSGPAGRSVASRRTDASSSPTSIALAPSVVLALGFSQMRDRQRAAAEVQRERGRCGQGPQPSRWFWFGFEVGHLAVSRPALEGLGLVGSKALHCQALAGGKACSGTPSSATSLILE